MYHRQIELTAMAGRKTKRVKTITEATATTEAKKKWRRGVVRQVQTNEQERVEVTSWKQAEGAKGTEWESDDGGSVKHTGTC